MFITMRCAHAPPSFFLSNNSPPLKQPSPSMLLFGGGRGLGVSGVKKQPSPPFVQTTSPSLLNRRGLRKPGHVAQETAWFFGERRPLRLPPFVKSTTCVAPQVQGSASTSLAGDEWCKNRLSRDGGGVSSSVSMFWDTFVFFLDANCRGPNNSCSQESANWKINIERTNKKLQDLTCFPYIFLGVWAG